MSVTSHRLTLMAENGHRESLAKQNLCIAECSFTVAGKHFWSEEQSLLKMDSGQLLQCFLSGRICSELSQAPSALSLPSVDRLLP